MIFPPRKSERRPVEGRYGFPNPETFEAVEPELLGDLFGWLAVDETKNIEGIIATAEGLPAFGDQARAEGLRDLAKLTARMLDVEVRLVRFTRADTVDTVKP